jgi:hypothetical protein
VGAGCGAGFAATAGVAGIAGLIGCGAGVAAAAGRAGGGETAASSSAMICLMDDKISSIDGSLVAGLFIKASFEH